MEENKEPVLEINKVADIKEQLEEAIKNSENKPTEEEIEKAKAEFEKATKEFTVKSWDVGEQKDAKDFISYAKHFIKNRIFWTKTGWMGVIKIIEEIEDSEKFINMNPTSPMKLGYQALEFLFYAFQNPGGVGLQSAKSFESENDLFIRVFDATGKVLNEARAELKRIQFLQDQYTAMQQGFYLEYDDSVEVEDSQGEEQSEPSEN